jgi:hypothetical protein
MEASTSAASSSSSSSTAAGGTSATVHNNRIERRGSRGNNHAEAAAATATARAVASTALGAAGSPASGSPRNVLHLRKASNSSSGFMDAGVVGGEQNEKLHRGSSKTMTAFRAILASTKLPATLRKRRSVGRTKHVAVHVDDGHDDEQQPAVIEQFQYLLVQFRAELIADNLLPKRHDDYHLMTRFVVFSLGTPFFKDRPEISGIATPQRRHVLSTIFQSFV